MPNELRIHPAANLFPMMGDVEYRELLADIREHGVRQALILIGESRDTAELIDGRNRARAITELGMDPYDYADVVHPDDIADPVEFVLSLNLHRRHLNESQRAMIANKVATLKQGEKQDTQICVSDTSQSDAAARLNVGVRSVQSARKVTENAVPTIIEAVERGEVSVSAAAQVASLPVVEQEKLAKEGPKAIKQAASEQRSTTKTAKAAGPLAELRAIFDEMEKPDELAVARFCEWVLNQGDQNTVSGGASLWISWGDAK